MRLLFFVLLVANLAFAGYALLRPRSDGEAQLVSQQLNADQIRVIPPRAPAAPPPRKSACMEWGSFNAAELTQVQRVLAPLRLGERLSTVEVPVTTNWWVFIPPVASRTDVKRKISELEELGVAEYQVIEVPGATPFAISLGIFRTEEAASSFLESLRQKGVRSARVGNREQRLTMTAVRVRDPDTQISARLAELHNQFPGSELKALDCPS
jgi:hypothetical protein